MQWQPHNPSSPYNWQGTGQQTQGGQQTSLPQVKGPEMNDRDRINDVMATEKYLTTAYNIAVNEASTEQLYRTQMSLLNELHQCQRDLFNLMHRKAHVIKSFRHSRKKFPKPPGSLPTTRLSFPTRENGTGSVVKKLMSGAGGDPLHDLDS